MEIFYEIAKIQYQIIFMLIQLIKEDTFISVLGIVSLIKWSVSFRKRLKRRKGDMADLSFEIVEFGTKIGKTSEKGWTTEVNKVSWSGRDAKWEIRPWNEDHTKCGKGYVFKDEEEMSMLGEYLQELGLC